MAILLRTTPRSISPFSAMPNRPHIHIIGTGAYLPTKVLTNHDLEKMVDTSDEWITTRTGIKERRVAAKDEAASDLATHAAKRALQNAGVKAEAIELIVVATATPDMFF